MKAFVVLLVCGLQLSTNVTMNSTLGVAGVLDPPLAGSISFNFAATQVLHICVHYATFPTSASFSNALTVLDLSRVLEISCSSSK